MLIGSECPKCQATSWPARAVCQNCAAATNTSVDLPPEGTLLSYTTVSVALKNIPAPYTLGQVELDGGALLFTHLRRLREDVRVPARVALRFPPSGQESAISFWFEPADAVESRAPF